MRRGVLAAAIVVIASVVCAPACKSDPPEGCTDGVRNDGELGVDCGGTCAKCAGEACTDKSQCNGGDCIADKCGAKPGKGCGVGTGNKCADGDVCELDADCNSDVCSADGKCTPPGDDVHSDGRRNGGESGIDCGGTIKDTKRCPDGQTCAQSSDCTGTCGDDGVCAASGPKDGRKDNGETDVDCGGPNAPGCALGKACAVDTDCADLYCPADKKTCVEPRTDDGIKNGTETDVDCGGKSGVKCGEAKSCKVDDDCVGACNYQNRCSDAPSCKNHMGGDTCGAGDITTAGGSVPGHESCCRTLPVSGYAAPGHEGKTVYLDKYEITAGRVRQFLAVIAAQNAGRPDVMSYVGTNTPHVWNASFNMFLPSDVEANTISVPHDPSDMTEGPGPWSRNVGTNFQFNQQLLVYVHGHNCGNAVGAYGFPTFFYPEDVQTKNGSLARAQTFADGNGTTIPIQEALDVKSMNCIPNALLAAFCSWDGGQLATDELLDYVTGASPTLGSGPGCGSRCAALGSINATSDSGTWTPVNYNFPFYADASTSEGTGRIAAPGRVTADVVRLNPADEPWMDLAGNLQEVVLDMSGATFTGKFGLKYWGIGYNSARALNNPNVLGYPEYKAGYSGGRCMRFR